MIFKPGLLILTLPLLLSACARAHGAMEIGDLNSDQINANQVNTDQIDEDPTRLDQAEDDDLSLLPIVEPAAIEPIINYVDSLNLALGGDLSKLKQAAAAECACLAISSRLASLFTNASLRGQGYKLTQLLINSDGPDQKVFDVVINRAALTKIEKNSGKQQIWSSSEIINQFVVTKRDGVWQLIQIR